MFVMLVGVWIGKRENEGVMKKLFLVQEVVGNIWGLVGNMQFLVGLNQVRVVDVIVMGDFFVFYLVVVVVFGDFVEVVVGFDGVYGVVGVFVFVFGEFFGVLGYMQIVNVYVVYVLYVMGELFGEVQFVVVVYCVVQDDIVVVL